eukprot:10971340-Heterocapsa_arctica.AAC.1
MHPLLPTIRVRPLSALRRPWALRLKDLSPTSVVLAAAAFQASSARALMAPASSVVLVPSSFGQIASMSSDGAVFGESRAI